MEFPCSQLYIMLAISGATLGVYVSNSEDLKIDRVFLGVPMLFVIVAWTQLMATLSSQNKPVADNPYDLYAHIITLNLFAASIAVLALATLSSRSDEVDFPT